METQELIIDNSSSLPPHLSPSKALKCFKTGEWKQALSHTIPLFQSLSTPLSTLIDLYKSGCSLACKLIQSSNIKLGIQITKKLNQLLPNAQVENFIPYQCEVLNYIACAYKQSEKLFLAKKYIDKAMLIVKDFPQVFWDKSSTYLNMCVILSAMGKHSDALLHAKTAIAVATEEMVEVNLNKDPENFSKKVTVLAIAYNNYAVEAEFLGDEKESLEFYKKSYEFVRTNDPGNIKMIQKLKESFMAAKKKSFPRSRSNFMPVKTENSAKTEKPIRNEKPTKITKSFAAYKSIKTCVSSKRIVNRVESETNTLKLNSEKNFLVFKKQCQSYLSSNNEWFKRKLSSSIENANKTEEIRNMSFKKQVKPGQVLMINAPVKGVENVRKPIIHEIFRQEEVIDEESCETVKTVKSEIVVNRRSSHILKRHSVNSFEMIPEQPVIAAQMLEEHKIQPPAEPQPVSVIQPTPIKPSPSPSLLIPTPINHIALLCKVQAHIRGYLSRERVKLLKSKPTILFRGVKKINKIRCLVSIIKKNNQIIVIINDGHEDQTILAPSDLTPTEIFKKLDKNEKGIHFKKEEQNPKPELIKTERVKLDKEDYQVKYYFNMHDKTLLVKATKYSNSRVFSLEKKDLSFNSKPLILRYVNDEIHPFLWVQEQKLVINREIRVIEREFLASGFRIINKAEVFFTVNKVVIQDGYSVEVHAEGYSNNMDNTQIFPTSEVLQNLSILQVNNLEDDPHAVLLLFHIQDNKIVLRKLDKKWLKCLYAEKGFFNGTEYMVKIYKLHDDSCTFFFQIHAAGAPPVASYSIADKDLAQVFKIPTKKIKPSINRIAKSLTIKNNRIQFSGHVRSDTFLAREIMIITKIQSFIRGHLLRDKVKLVTNLTPLIYSCTRDFEDSSVTLNFFRVNTSLFIEALFADLQKSFYLLIQKPNLFFNKFSRLYDIKCIANSVVFNMETFVIPSLKGNLQFCECNFMSNEEESKSKVWPMIKLKVNTNNDYVMCIRELDKGSLVVKVLKLTEQPVCMYQIFSKHEIEQEEKGYKPEVFAKKLELVNGKIVIVNVKKEAETERIPTGERILFRTIRKFDEKLYQIVLNMEKDLMVFSFRQGSDPHSYQRVEVLEHRACEMSGFEKGYLIPMADFMCRKMFKVEKESIILVEPTTKFSLVKTLMRIQATVRGFFVRKLIQKKINFHILLKSTLKIEKKTYRVFLYNSFNEYSLCLIRLPLILTSKLNKKLIEDNLNRLEKIFLSKVLLNVTIKDKNGVLTIAGLKEWKQSNSIFVQTDKESQLSSNRSVQSFTRALSLTQIEKVLKWRSPRTISEQKCIVSIFEVGDKGLVEIFILATDQTLDLEVSLELIKDPGLLAGQLEIKNEKIVMKNEGLNVVFLDKRYISNKFAEIVIFFTDKGFFATAYLPEENKSLNAFLGVEVNPEEAVKELKIKEVMGQDVLILGSNI